MIFIDWIVAAAVRFHYELKAQVTAPGADKWGNQIVSH